jgi:hypothetical protein
MTALVKKNRFLDEENGVEDGEMMKMRLGGGTAREDSLAH